MDTAIFVTDKLYARPYVPSDAEAISKEANNPKVSKFMTNMFPSPYTLADAEAWIKIATERKPIRNFAIFKLDGTYVGGIGLKPGADVYYRTMEIGYWIGEAHWGQGLTTEVARHFTRWAFENIPELLRLEAGVFDGNHASLRVLAKVGYTSEGPRRKAGFKHGKAFDIHYMSMLREECPGLKEDAKAAE
ncbi:acyl-CoA N-acyltransferase [Thozetella sp. PMI_491]|nr:acyl-CoA N-acyltransferase [Thozetella sp. PMI_491]